MSNLDLEVEERDLMLEIADFLEELMHSDELKARYANYSLCGVVDKKFDVWLSSHFDYFILWPGYNGDIDYPVGGEDEYNNELVKMTFWQNPKRLDLALYVAKRLREDALNG